MARGWRGGLGTLELLLEGEAAARSLPEARVGERGEAGHGGELGAYLMH